MAAEKVLTGAIAIVRVNGVAIGKMKNIRATETLQRGEVRGIGSITPSELPPLTWAGTLTCDFFNIDFSKSQLPGAIYRNTASLQAFVDSVLLQEDGITVDIFKKVNAGTNTSGLMTSQEVPYAQIQGLFLNTESFDITEGQISGRNQSFQYIYPIVY